MTLNITLKLEHKKELAAFGRFCTELSTIAEEVAVDSDARQARLYGNGFASNLAANDVASYTAEEQVARTIPVPKEPITQEQAEALVSATKRERGKPSPGSTRRTKAEIAEDEAADAADAAAKSPPVERDITNNPENRGADDEATAEQDAADEQAEADAKVDASAPLTHDDVRAAMGKYVKAYGMAAAQADGPILIQRVLGDETKSKISELPDDQAVLAKAVAGVEEMISKNPFKRAAEGVLG